MQLKSEQKTLHFSHLYQYVSAYEMTQERLEQLEEDIRDAVTVAKDSRTKQFVDMDGEMFFVVYPSGMIALCLRWQEFTISEEE